MAEAPTPDPFPSWDDLRFFLATAKAGSVSKAANLMRTTQPTISRRVEGLERQLDVRLFVRSPGGVALTAEGERVLEVAHQIEASILDLQISVLSTDRRLSGSVTVSVPDGLATFWIAPRLRGFQERYPDISVEFQTSVQPANVLNLESDISISPRRPEAPDLVARKIATFHLVPWAAPDYLERNGTPRSTKELAGHCLLDHDHYHIDDPGYDLWHKLGSSSNRARYRTNSSTAMLSAARSGLGISLFPTYFCTFVTDLVPLDVNARTSISIWLSYHPDVQQAARVRAVIDWIKGLFDHDSCPWFRDEFHFPKQDRRRASRLDGLPRVNGEACRQG